MDQALLELCAASLAFVGTHFALSHPLRAPLVKVVGEGAFLGLYSLVAFAALGWMVLAFRDAPIADLGGSGMIGWVFATGLMIPALALFAGAFYGNPALPAPGAEKLAAKEPSGAFTITRHPMMWGFALWALAHIALWWSTRTLIVASAILVLALLGAHLQDRKKEALMGAAWAGWEAKTSYWPRLGGFAALGWMHWLAALILWLAITWAHIPGAGIPAGIFHWL